MSTIHIIVGSVMGTATHMAQTIQSELQHHGLSTRLDLAFTPQESALAQDEVLIVCTSNTGMGDLPENIRPFHTYLSNSYPAIAGKPFAIINLGDSSYPNFAQAGQTIYDALCDLGATPFGDTLVMDALSDENYDDAAKSWVQNHLTKLKAIT